MEAAAAHSGATATVAAELVVGVLLPHPAATVDSNSRDNSVNNAKSAFDSFIEKYSSLCDPQREASSGSRVFVFSLYCAP